MNIAQTRVEENGFSSYTIVCLSLFISCCVSYCSKIVRALSTRVQSQHSFGYLQNKRISKFTNNTINKVLYIQETENRKLYMTLYLKLALTTFKKLSNCVL